MSSPFPYRAPASIPFSGTADANGNFSVQITPRSAFWSSLKAICSASSGFPTWKVSRDGVPVGFARGTVAEIGGLIIPPNAKLQIDAIGAAPSATILGSLEGTQSVDQQAVAQSHLPVPNVIGVSARPAFTSQVPSADTTSANTYAHVQDGSGFQLGDTILVTTQNNAVPTQTIGVIKQITAPNQGPVSTPQTNIGVNLIIFGTFAFAPAANDIVELVPPVAIFNSATVPLFTDVIDRAARLLGVVQEGANPPLWQAPNKVPITLDTTIGAGGTTVFIPAVANQVVRIFSLSFTPTAVVQLQDTGGTEWGSVAANTVFAFGPSGPFGTGLGFQIKAPAGAASVNGSVSYSQG